MASSQRTRFFPIDGAFTHNGSLRAQVELAAIAGIELLAGRARTESRDGVGELVSVATLES